MAYCDPLGVEGVAAASFSFFGGIFSLESKIELSELKIQKAGGGGGHRTRQAGMGDLIGALAGYIGGKDVRVTGQIASLPVYKGKLEKPPEKKPKGELTEKQKQLNAYLEKYKVGDDKAGDDADKHKKKKRKVRRGEEPGRGLKIIDEDKGMGGLALARAKGALRSALEPMLAPCVCTLPDQACPACHSASICASGPCSSSSPSQSLRRQLLDDGTRSAWERRGGL